MSLTNNSEITQFYFKTFHKLQLDTAIYKIIFFYYQVRKKHVKFFIYPKELSSHIIIEVLTSSDAQNDVLIDYVYASIY